MYLGATATAGRGAPSGTGTGGSSARRGCCCATATCGIGGCCCSTARCGATTAAPGGSSAAPATAARRPRTPRAGGRRGGRAWCRAATRWSASTSTTTADGATPRSSAGPRRPSRTPHLTAESLGRGLGARRADARSAPAPGVRGDLGDGLRDRLSASSAAGVDRDRERLGERQLLSRARRGRPPRRARPSPRRYATDVQRVQLQPQVAADAPACAYSAGLTKRSFERDERDTTSATSTTCSAGKLDSSPLIARRRGGRRGPGSAADRRRVRLRPPSAMTRSVAPWLLEQVGQPAQGVLMLERGGVIIRGHSVHQLVAHPARRAARRRPRPSSLRRRITG